MSDINLVIDDKAEDREPTENKSNTTEDIPHESSVDNLLPGSGMKVTLSDLPPTQLFLMPEGEKLKQSLATELNDETSKARKAPVFSDLWNQDLFVNKDPHGERRGHPAIGGGPPVRGGGPRVRGGLAPHSGA